MANIVVMTALDFYFLENVRMRNAWDEYEYQNEMAIEQNKRREEAALKDKEDAEKRRNGSSLPSRN